MVFKKITRVSYSRLTLFLPILANHTLGPYNGKKVVFIGIIKRTRIMIKKTYFSPSFIAYAFIATLCVTYCIHPMNNTHSLDDLLLGAPHDWELYLKNYSLQEIFKIIKKSDQNYASMADSKGNNLMLTFLELDYTKNGDCCSSDCKKTLTKKEIQQFINQDFDINFQNKKTGNTILIKIIYYALRNDVYIPLDLIKWLIPLCKKSLNLKDNDGYTPLLYSYRDYTIMALLLKYNATRSLPISNGQDHHWHSKKTIVQLETMFGPALTGKGYLENGEARNFITHMYAYDAIILKPFVKNKFIKLIDTSKENVAFFNRAAICNDIKILDHFTKNGTNQDILLRILKHCCTWNRAGATQYALSNLDPNRYIILMQTEKTNSKANSKTNSINTITHSKSKEKPTCATPFIGFYRFITQRFYSASEPIATVQDKKKSKELEIPELERKLIDIYNYARKEPKTGFRAWLFLETFNKYLTFGNQKSVDEDVFTKYKKNYDINFKFLKRDTL